MFEQKSLTKAILVYLFVAILTIMNLSNIKIAGLNNAIPPLDLMAIFYFTVFKNRFGLTFIFLIGIWNDALSGNPLGLTSLCYIVLIKLFIIFNNRIFAKENFIQIWQQFVAFAFLFLLLKWVLLIIINGKVSSLFVLLAQFIISSFGYVLMHMVLDFINKKLFGEQ